MLNWNNYYVEALKPQAELWYHEFVMQFDNSQVRSIWVIVIRTMSAIPGSVVSSISGMMDNLYHHSDNIWFVALSEFELEYYQDKQE